MPKLRIKPENIMLIDSYGENAELCCKFNVSSELAGKILMHLIELGMLENFVVNRRKDGAAYDWTAEINHI